MCILLKFELISGMNTNIAVEIFFINKRNRSLIQRGKGVSPNNLLCMYHHVTKFGLFCEKSGPEKENFTLLNLKITSKGYTSSASL